MTNLRALSISDVGRSFWWKGPMLAVIYFLVAKLGLTFTVVTNNITLIWPPSGLALFALLVLGLRFWPWVFFAALAVNATTDIPLLAALTVAIGNTMEAIVAVCLLRKVGFHRELRSVRDVMLLVLLAAGLSTMLSATVGTYSLAYFEVISWNYFAYAWLSWWMGDAMGVLIFTPLLLSWSLHKEKAYERGRGVEIVVLLLTLMLVTQFVFGNQVFLFDNPKPLAFITFPILIWAAMRFGMLGATSAVLVVAGVALLNIIYGRGIFSQGSSFESLTLLWLYANFLAVTSMVLAASINEREMAQTKLRHLSQHDPLTGLRNRFSLKEDLNVTIARSARHHYQTAILFMDLDHFKAINDTLGHTIGDQLLIQIGLNLQENKRMEDVVYRLGGDEFVIILENIQNSEYAGKVAEKIVKLMSQPFNVRNNILHTGASIGVSLYPNDGEDVDSLLKHADTAMYRAKDLGRNTTAFYSPEMNIHAEKKMKLEADLRKAMVKEEFELHYQPQYDAAFVQIGGCEALLRWRKTDGELVLPNDFIPLLEETGLIKPVGRWVIETACAQLAKWNANGWDSLRMSINMSAHQLGDTELVSYIADCLSRYKLDPGWLAGT
ncbi:MAG: diguanylate cyclase [Cycloclasticus sp.]|nr:diguanylate cyclase [Cycloclasticus sp.]